MKYLLILLLVLAIAWQWRNARRGEMSDKQTRSTPPTAAQDMVACAHCGVHLPMRDAVQGNAGHYCDARHRAGAEH